MTVLWLDYETFSETPIKDGAHRYAENSEILIFAWAIEDEPAEVWDCTSNAPCPPRLAAALANPDVIIRAHNTGFDRTVMNHDLLQPTISVDRWEDTMVQAMAHGLPGSLATLCEILGVDSDKAKDKDGKALIQLFCKPRKFSHKLTREHFASKARLEEAIEKARLAWNGRATSKTHPAEWAKFVEYARLDIEAMRAVYKKLPKWNYQGAELALWRLDQRINDRGVAIDLELAAAAVRAVEKEQERLADWTLTNTAGQVESATQVAALISHIHDAYGIKMSNMQMATLEMYVNHPDTPAGLRELLKVRLQASTSSTSKYKTLLRGTSSDGRLRGVLQFCGASRTGRWAGRLFQPQNLPRPTLDQEQIDCGIEALKADCADLIFDDVMRLSASAIRGVIVAPRGKKLVIADLSNIEGRVQAWLAGEAWKMKAFTAFDTITGTNAKGEPIRLGQDLYKLAYGKSFGIAPEDVTKDQRQIGKVMELACLGADTKVVTNNGVKRIVDVAINDLLWDGKTWVKHQGLLARGARKVVHVAGIEVTPDHLMLTGETWTPASQLALHENTLSLALATGSANLPSSVLRRDQQAERLPLSKLSATAVPRRTRHTTTIFGTADQRLVTYAQKRKRAIGVRITGLTRIFAPTTHTAVDYLTAYPLATTDATIRKTEDSPTTAGGVLQYLRRGDQTGGSSCGILLRLKGGIRQVSNWIGSMLTKTTHLEIFGSFRTRLTRTTNDLSAFSKVESTNLKPTFDILNAGPLSRFTVISDKGALIVHNCGYEGGVGAFATFSAVYGIDLDDLADRAAASMDPELWERAIGMLEWHRKNNRNPTASMSESAWLTCEAFKLAWREAHPAIASYWKELDKAVRKAIEHPGEAIQCRRLKVYRKGAWLRILLPSGRSVTYPIPSITDGKITYKGVDQYTRKWKALQTYGGKIFENVCQAVARDVMAHNMPLIEAAGYEIVLTVHDEVICEAPDSDEFNEDHLAKLLAANPPWALDMPLAAAGFQTKRYKKD